MNEKDRSTVFNYLHENLKGIDLSSDNDTDNYIDFENGLYFSNDDVNRLYEIYNKMENKLDAYVDNNDLDNVMDCDVICDHFREYEQYIQQFGQAIMIPFDNFALIFAQKIADQKLLVNYNTGAGNELVATLEEAKALADDGSCYTGHDITIEREDGDVIACRRWYDINPDEEDEIDMDNIIRFGTEGYYGEWAS